MHKRNEKINLEQNSFDDKTFHKEIFDKLAINNKSFENCLFNKSSFIETKFINCSFIDCEFKSCNLSSIEPLNSTFTGNITFIESKLLGVNWTKAKWPQIKLTSPLKFYLCNITYSSFFELELPEIVIEECKAHEVDFRGGIFSFGCFVDSDFERSMFMHTKLNSTDFTGAINYNINPLENEIRKSKFSTPDVINLLKGFDIKID